MKIVSSYLATYIYTIIILFSFIFFFNKFIIFHTNRKMLLITFVFIFYPIYIYIYIYIYIIFYQVLFGICLFRKYLVSSRLLRIYLILINIYCHRNNNKKGEHIYIILLKIKRMFQCRFDLEYSSESHIN